MHRAICPLCEATCGLTIETRDREVVGIRGNAADVFSRGYICPKGFALKALDADPDRLRQPLMRRGDGFEAVTWDAAFDEIARRLPAIRAAHGADATAIYLGNPNVHNLSSQLYAPVLIRALGSRNIYSASTLDQMPRHLVSGYLYGDMLTIPIPDLDHTDFLLILGANPLASNGSLMTAPDVEARLRDLRRRGGRLVVVDPRRTRTAEVADEHIFIRPGTDALLLLAMAHTLAPRAQPAALAAHLDGFETALSVLADFSPERVAARCGIDAARIRALAEALAEAPRACVYGRLGTCTQRFGTLATWAIDLLNVMTGNLDRVGGAMFPRAAAGGRNTGGAGGRGKGMRPSKVTSRVRGWPQVFGELPTATLADEILTAGDGQVRALITVAGNPALSAPNGERLDRALAGLEFMVSFDCYVNETTRHAHVILPPPSHLERSHYDLVFAQLAVRNTARYAPAVLARAEGQPDDWEILLRLTAAATGQAADVATLDRMVAAHLVGREVATPGSRIEGQAVDAVLASLAPRRGPERLLDFLLRVGPYEGLSLDVLEAAPDGIDLGPLQPRLPEVLRTASGRIELAPAAVLADVARLRATLDEADDGLRLIGRRNLRSNNSWMHNLPLLVKGRPMCTLLVHPADAARHGVADGGRARVTSEAGSVEVTVEVSASVMEGVVSLPHGWGHDLAGTRMAVARRNAGASVNRLVSDAEIEPLSGNAIQNGVAVTLQAL